MGRHAATAYEFVTELVNSQGVEHSVSFGLQCEVESLLDKAYKDGIEAARRRVGNIVVEAAMEEMLPNRFLLKAQDGLNELFKERP